MRGFYMYDYYVKFADCIEPDFLPATTPQGLKHWLEEIGKEVYRQAVMNYGGHGITLVCIDKSRQPCYILCYKDINALLAVGQEQGIFE